MQCIVKPADFIGISHMRHSSFNQVNSSTNLSIRTNDTIVQMDKIRDKKGSTMQQSLNQLSLAESYPVLRLTKPYKTV